MLSWVSKKRLEKALDDLDLLETEQEFLKEEKEELGKYYEDTIKDLKKDNERLTASIRDLKSTRAIEDDREDDNRGAAYHYFSTHAMRSHREREVRLSNPFPVTPETFHMVDGATDEVDNTQSAKSAFVLNRSLINAKLLDWYVSQSFIGYQACALVAQHWLIDKGCGMKGRDAVRNGFHIVFDEGDEVTPDIKETIERLDRKFKIKKRLAKADKFKNIFGICHVLFIVDSDDPEFYEKPFNPDGIKPGSYKGIKIVDPYWVTPLLSTEAVENPGSRGFYEPTYWVVAGKKYHCSHFVILRGPEVSDVLKPSYLYGGLPMTQLALERVYAAERTANEAPQLAMTKRLVVRYIQDIEKAVANQQGFEEAMQALSEWRDNFGVYVSSVDDRVEQQDTSLADLDITIMTQYQIVAGIFGVPETKLMGTSPKGFHSTGQHDIKSYHEELESVRENDMDPILEKHHICLVHSHIAQLLPDQKPINVGVVWNPLAVISERERAETQEIKARTYKTIQDAGAIDGYDIRNAVIADENSPLSGIESLERLEERDELPDLEDLLGLEPSVDPPAEEKDDKSTKTNDIVRKKGRRWVVLSEDGEELGVFNTRKEAFQQLEKRKEK